MYRFYQKSKLNFSLAWIAAYVVLASAADHFSELLGFLKAVTAPLLVVFSLFLFWWLKAHGLLAEYGLCPFQGDRKQFLYFLPLLLILTTNLWNGVTGNASAGETALYILNMLCVGFLEEIIFRGFLFKALAEENVKRAVLIASLTFGLGHLVNLLNGADFVPTLFQICYASAIGFLFTTIFYKGKSLLPCIVTHGLLNAFGIFSVEASRSSAILRAVILSAVSVGYALWLWKKAETPGSD